MGRDEEEGKELDENVGGEEGEGEGANREGRAGVVEV